MPQTPAQRVEEYLKLHGPTPQTKLQTELGYSQSHLSHVVNSSSHFLSQALPAKLVGAKSSSKPQSAEQLINYVRWTICRMAIAYERSLETEGLTATEAKFKDNLAKVMNTVAERLTQLIEDSDER